MPLRSEISNFEVSVRWAKLDSFIVFLEMKCTRFVMHKRVRVDLISIVEIPRKPPTYFEDFLYYFYVIIYFSWIRSDWINHQRQTTLWTKSDAMKNQNRIILGVDFVIVLTEQNIFESLSRLSSPNYQTRSTKKQWKAEWKIL